MTHRHYRRFPEISIQIIRFESAQKPRRDEVGGTALQLGKGVVVQARHTWPLQRLISTYAFKDIDEEIL